MGNMFIDLISGTPTSIPARIRKPQAEKSLHNSGADPYSKI